MYTSSSKVAHHNQSQEGLDAKSNPYRVLVVDDEEIVRKLLTQILKSMSYDICAEAVDGVMAVDMYKQLNPDIVTMDIQMPRLNGLEALKKIMAADQEAVVVMLTSVADKDIVVDILKAGAKDYIVKPIKRKFILDKLAKIRKPTAKRVRKAQS
jgi:two-component system chemotaxis response regulator CheY